MPIYTDGGVLIADGTSLKGCCCVECASGGCSGPASLLLDMYGIVSTPADHERRPNLASGVYAIEFHGSNGTNYLGGGWSFGFSCGWIGPVAGTMCINTGTIFSPVYEYRDVRPMYYEATDKNAVWIHQGETTTWEVLANSLVVLDTESTADTNRPCSWVPYEGERASSNVNYTNQRDCTDSSLDTVNEVIAAYTVKVYAP